MVRILSALAGCTMLALLATALPANSQVPITEQEAHAIGVDAYLYFYPLVTMDITRKQATNIEPGKEFGSGPMNMFVNVPAYPPADFRDVVRPNFDTLYSIAGSISPRSRWSSRRRIPAGATICCRCSTCGPTCSRRPAGARPAPGGQFPGDAARLDRNGARGAIDPHQRADALMSGSSAAPRPTARRTIRRCTRSRRATRSRRCRMGQAHPSRSR